MKQNYSFCGRPFFLKRDNLLKREERIFELLVTDFEGRIVYPYELLTINGRHVTRWRTLSVDEVKTLFDDTNTHTLAERLDWSDRQITVDGELAAIGRIAPVAHFTLTCTLLDKGMQVTPFDVYLPIEDFVSLMLRFLDQASYGMTNLEASHHFTYQRIMNKCPHPMTATSAIAFTTVQMVVARMKGFGNHGDEVSERSDNEGECHHVVAYVDEKRVEMCEESTDDFDIISGDRLIIDDVPALCRAVSAYTAAAVVQAFIVMLKDSDGTMAPIKEFLTDNGISFTLKK